jgi:hypothetical protein
MLLTNNHDNASGLTGTVANLTGGVEGRLA